MLLKALDNSTFEMKLMRYEYPGAKEDWWNLNLLRVLLLVHYSSGIEARTTTYLLTSEVNRLIAWFDAILQNNVKEPDLHFYHSELYFELFELFEEYVAFRAHFYFGSGKETLLPKEREEEYEWSGYLEFDLTLIQLEMVLLSLKSESVLLPERASIK